MSENVTLIGTTTSAVNLRERPGLNFTIKTVLPAQTSIVIIADQGEWLQVNASGQEGFVNRAFVLLPGQKIMSGFLVDLPEVREWPLAPATSLAAPANAPKTAATAARIWNKFGGVLGPLSDKLGIDPGVGVAVVAAESGGRGFAADGRMIIRFENHVFWSEWGKANPNAFNPLFQFSPGKTWQGHVYRAKPNRPWLNVHDSQDSEWSALGVAQGLNDRAAKRSISMGLPQIMGFNHASIGYESGEAMFTAFSTDERTQLIGFFDFVQGPHPVSRRVIALKEKNFLAFAEQYNGPGQASTYASIIQGLFDGFQALKPAS